MKIGEGNAKIEKQEKLIITERILFMKQREFAYIGEDMWELNEQEYAVFFMNIQKAILLLLEKRNLLTASQRECCLIELEKQITAKKEYCDESI